MRVSTSRLWNSAGVQSPPMFTCSAILPGQIRGPRDPLGKVGHSPTKQIQGIAEVAPGVVAPLAMSGMTNIAFQARAHVAFWQRNPFGLWRWPRKTIGY